LAKASITANAEKASEHEKLAIEEQADADEILANAMENETDLAALEEALKQAKEAQKAADLA
jgi:hypothetical protein